MSDPGGDVRSRQEAQRRVDRIDAFRQELHALTRDGVLTLPPEARADVDAYHARTIDALERRFDVDRSASVRRMSRGMQVASLLGAVAFSAALYSFFLRIWGHLTTPAQVAILIAAPIACLLAIEPAARRERTLYVASIVAFMALGAFVLELHMLGQIFNMRSTPGAFLAWGAFALALAYAYDLRLLLAVGLMSVTVFLSARLVMLAGGSWTEFDQRPETYALTGLLIAALATRLGDTWRPGFGAVFRGIGLSTVCLGLLFLSSQGPASFLPLSGRHAELWYQAVSLAAAGALITIGIRRQWMETFHLGTIFLMLFLLIRFVDWWWDVLPRYQFFTLVGLIAVVFLLALRRLRHRLIGVQVA